MMCANMCGMQLVIINIVAGKSLLFQYAYKMICFIKNKKIARWYACNAQQLAHLPMLFMAKLHKFFQNLAFFSQNSIIVEHGATGNELDIRNVSIAVKLAAKFWKKMNDHIKDNTVPKEIPSFARTMFTEQASGIVTADLVAIDKSAATSTASIEAKGQKSGNEPSKKKQKQETSDKSLKMGLFHMEKGATVATALPKKGKLKEDMCMDFCCHNKKCNFPHLLCRNGKHYTTWKKVPDKDKAVLLTHMDEKKKMWLDVKMFARHKVTIAPEFSHLLGDALGPKQRSSGST